LAEFRSFGYGNIDYRHQLRKKSKLGEGNFGEVWLSILRRTRPWPARLVAVKELTSGGGGANIVQEALVMQDIKDHPNVVKLLGVCMEPPCLVLELVEGAMELDDYLRHAEINKSGVEYARMACLNLVDISCGVAHMHSNGVVHRDLAARNVLVDSQGLAKVTDFGLSSGQSSQRNSCATGSMSPGRDTADSEILVDIDPDGAYFRAAPENYGLEEFDFQQVHVQKSDVFMFGMMMWEVLSTYWGKETGGRFTRGYSIHFEEARGLPDMVQLDQVTSPKSGRGPQQQSEKKGMLKLAKRLKQKGVPDAMVQALWKLNSTCLRRDYKLRPGMAEVATSILRVYEEIAEYTNTTITI